jgi:hypothetical protein
MKINYRDIKIRKSWGFNPATKVHSTPKGLKGYDRNEVKRDNDDSSEEYKSIAEQNMEMITQ